MGVRLSVVMRRKRDGLALRLPALPQASVPQADVLICSSRIQPIATFLLADLQTSPLPDPKQMSLIGASWNIVVQSGRSDGPAPEAFKKGEVF